MDSSQLSPFAQLGLKPYNVPAQAGTAPGIERAAGPGILDATGDRPWHPDNPLFWFGVIALATFGLIAGSTSFKVGPFRGSASVGKP